MMENYVGDCNGDEQQELPQIQPTPDMMYNMTTNGFNDGTVRYNV